MQNRFLVCALGFLICAGTGSAVAADALSPPARSWIDPATGHRIVRLSDTPGSLSLYFNYNAYTPQKDKMVFATPDGISALDLKTFRISRVVRGKVRLLFAGRKSRLVYYQSSSAPAPGDRASDAKIIRAADIDSGKSRIVARIAHGGIQSINADETLIAGVEEHAAPGILRHDGLYVQSATGKKMTKGEMMEARLAAKIPMEIFTIDLRTGRRRTVIAATDWLNHLQFSPTDPDLLMYCHEGPWHKVDRVWLIRLDTKNARPLKLHTRTMNREIAGHEWFSADGKTVWYDLQTPRGEDFWVAGYDLKTARRTWYHLQRNQWSVHYNSNADNTLFSGDGGDPGMVAHAPDGKWLYLFRPHLFADSFVAGQGNAPLIRTGYFTAEKLVSMAGHNYHLEPNARFSPDGRWLFFRSNLQNGKSYVYAVSLKKADAK